MIGHGEIEAAAISIAMTVASSCAGGISVEQIWAGQQVGKDRDLTLIRRVRIMISPHADVAELADAQVSEACDGDIVEVQVLSSAPAFFKLRASLQRGSLFYYQK